MYCTEHYAVVKCKTKNTIEGFIKKWIDIFLALYHKKPEDNYSSNN